MESAKMCTVEDVKRIAINAFKNSLNKKYFEVLRSVWCKLERNFTTDSSDEGLWSLASEISDKAHRYTLNILTIDMNSQKRDGVRDTNILKPIENIESNSSLDLQKLADCKSLLKPTKNKKDTEIDCKRNKDSNLDLQKNCQIAKVYWNQQKIKKNTEMDCEKDEDLENNKSKNQYTEPQEIFEKKTLGSFMTPSEPKKICLNNLSSMKSPLITEIPYSNDKWSSWKRCFWDGDERSMVTHWCSHRTIEIYGMKPKYIVREVTILRQISHENIVSIMGICFQGMHFHIVMELINGHSLK